MPRKLLGNSLGLIWGAAARSHPKLSGYRRFVAASSGPPTHSMYILRWRTPLWYIGNLKMSNIHFCQRDIAAGDRLWHPDDSRSFTTCAFRGGWTCGLQTLALPTEPQLTQLVVIGQELGTSLKAACPPNCDGEFWGERLWQRGEGEKLPKVERRGARATLAAGGGAYESKFLLGMKHPDHKCNSCCLFLSRQKGFRALNSCVAQWVFNFKIQKCGSNVPLSTFTDSY